MCKVKHTSLTDISSMYRKLRITTSKPTGSRNTRLYISSTNRSFSRIVFAMFRFSASFVDSWCVSVINLISLFAGAYCLRYSIVVSVLTTPFLKVGYLINSLLLPKFLAPKRGINLQQVVSVGVQPLTLPVMSR